jgi:hypothetical protein
MAAPTYSKGDKVHYLKVSYADYDTVGSRSVITHVELDDDNQFLFYVIGVYVSENAMPIYLYVFDESELTP